ncbi:hypothetical protein K449DRAFT_380179 [Hypoxylon sp. EC38]|nr:hypothetical protein K449DRAFT_380179 [Hypoxylon sp. EC38]
MTPILSLRAHVSQLLLLYHLIHRAICGSSMYWEYTLNSEHNVQLSQKLNHTLLYQTTNADGTRLTPCNFQHLSLHLLY